jgi:hypothetical protein
MLKKLVSLIDCWSCCPLSLIWDYGLSFYSILVTTRYNQQSINFLFFDITTQFISFYYTINLSNLQAFWASLNIIYRKVFSLYDNICPRYCLFSILNKLWTNVHSELYTYVIDTELQLSGKTSLTIPKDVDTELLDLLDNFNYRFISEI